MSTAARTRDAITAYPFLLMALRAGVLNYTAAARFLGVEDVDAGAAALRRLAEDLPALETISPTLRVRMESGMGPVEDPSEAKLVVGDTAIGSAVGDWTAVVAEGEVELVHVSQVLARIAHENVDPIAASFASDCLVVVTDRSDAHRVIQAIEACVTSSNR